MKRREAIGFDITPLIDIVFILFTFFLVATTMKKDKRELNLTLPKTDSYYAISERKSNKILLNSEKILLNSKSFTFLELNKLDNSLKKLKKNKIIEFYISKDVNYEKISKILNLLSKNKLSNISLITDSKNLKKKYKN